MNLRTALQVTVILGWAGLVAELARTNPWVIALIAVPLWLVWFNRTR